MERWKLLAFFAMIFGGLTSVMAKAGMKNIGPDLGLFIRTVVVFGRVLANLLVSGQLKQIPNLNRSNLFFFCISGFCTSLSWILYYKAFKNGPLATIALIDNFGIVITLAFSVIFLGEQITARFIIGALLMLSGLLILILK